jgi:general stress protein YciG
VSTPGGRRGRQQRNIDREQEVISLREQALRLAQIGRRVGINRTSVANALKRQGRADLFGRRGFAALSPERRREIASMGGKASHAAGTGHRFTVEEARAAGSKGGKAAHALGRAHEFTVQEAREAAKKAARKRGGGGG